VNKPNIQIVDVVQELGSALPSDHYIRYLYKCLAPHPYRRYRKRAQYLEEAAQRGLRKEILFMNGDAVGQIEYASAAVSAYPISGDDVYVMNCIWVLRKAKGHRFGQMLMESMIEDVGDAAGIATVALDGHPSPWLKLSHMEYLGFRPLESIKIRHKTKHRDVCFKVYLMWMPLRGGAEPPVMDWKAMLRGVDFCIAHPLYRVERLGLEEIYEKC